MTPTRSGQYVLIPAGHNQIVIDVSAGVPHIVHIGPPLAAASVDDLAALTERPLSRASIDVEAVASLLPEHGSGWFGRAGIRGHRPDGSGWSPRFTARSVDIGAESVRVEAGDDIARLSLTTDIAVQPQSVRIRLTLVNNGDTDYSLDDMTVLVPVPERASEILRLGGRWSHEFQAQRHDWPDGSISFDNRRGRTSHDRVPALWVGQPGFGENHGEVWGVALGWSGNSVVVAERLNDGRRVLQLGELLAPGDVELAPGAGYSTPWLEVAYSAHGLNGVSQAFHESIRARDVAPAVEQPRKVLLNTWEAVYFDHDLETLQRLASVASDVGVERFVLDDGWFHGRRSDKAGLGDWWVDDKIWPQGLTPLVDHVTSLGMDFGIWVEPEMVNRDSDLNRAHPDWVLSATGYEAVEGRHQLVLDLSRADVMEYLVEKLDRLLSDHDVAYVKWDMNRDLVHASSGFRAALHDNMLGVYALFDEMRARHPNVEFESCSSGGGRADFEILERTERIWTSDSNDALERQGIQRGFSMLFPPEVMGAHIGGPRSHTSGRRHSLSFRTATAFFGHLGIEWNLLAASDAELATVRDVLEAHKDHRRLLHSGTLHRLDCDDPHALSFMVVSENGDEALLSFAQLDLSAGAVPSRLRLAGLDPARRYDIVPLQCFGPVDGPAEQQPEWIDSKLTATGESLLTIGLQPPSLHPEAAIVAHIVAS